MYKSPIEIIQSDIQMKTEECIVKAMQKIGVNIDKDELIEALKYDRKQYEKGYADGIAAAQRWIPCSERKPPDGINPHTMDYKLYACSCDFGGSKDVRAYKYGDGHFWNGPGVVDKYVVAWMPLPEPYRAEGEETDGEA